MKRQLMVLLVVLAGISRVCYGEMSDYFKNLEEKAKQYQAIRHTDESLRLYKEGRISEVNSVIKSFVKDEDKSALDYFMISNMLYKSDVTTSDLYMGVANSKMPTNPYILYELAMREHRKGNCEKALSLYEQAAELSSDLNRSSVLWAYATHCGLALGDYKRAVSSWGKVDFANEHIEIEKAMYEIFSQKDNDVGREKYMALALGGSADAVCELIELDHSWEIDWWNVRANTEYLKFDADLMKSVVKKYPSLKPAYEICVGVRGMSDSEFVQYVNVAGYWGDKHSLPESSVATYVLIRNLENRKVAKPDEMLDKYEAILVKRFEKNPSDKRNLDVLSHLYIADRNQNKLRKYDLYGWKALKDQKYTESYVAGTSGADADYEQVVSSAAADFPNSTLIQKENFKIKERSSGRDLSLMKFTAAQFAEVGRYYYSSPFRLNHYMAYLRREVEGGK